MNNLSIEILKRMRASEAEAVADDVGDKEILAVLDELIAIRELKGDQVPVAWTDAEELRGMGKDGCGYLFKVDPANPFTDPRRQIMLYDRPQKPVDDTNQKWFMPKRLDRALTIMGVSIPESREELSIHVTRWIQRLVDRVICLSDELAEAKPVVSKEKLCDWLEDNFDIDDSQRDAFADCFAQNCNCIVKPDRE